MKVSANLPSGTKPASRSLPASLQQPKGRNGGFAELLRGANGHRAADFRVPNLVVGAGNSRFEVETKIGDDAIRFDARPIVAPTGGTKSVGGTDAGIEPSPIAKITEASVPTYAELAKLVAHLAQNLPAIAEHLTARSGPAAIAETASARPSGAPLPTGMPAAAPPAPGGREPLSLITKLTEAIAAKPTAAPPPLQTSTLAARVTALPREIVIMLRGVTLSAEERETLADTVQRELAPLRLNERTIRIMGAGGTV